MIQNRNVQLFDKWLHDSSFYADNCLKNQQKLQLQAEKKVLNLFHKAANNVPAYKDFLKKNNTVASKIKTIKDFIHVPPISKENYIDRYDTNSRCWRGN